MNLENVWLLAGAVGVASGSAWLNGGTLSRVYDLPAGLLFSASGAIGVLRGMGLHPLASVSALSGIITASGVLGMSIAVYPAVIHTPLGYTSLTHAFEA